MNRVFQLVGTAAMGAALMFAQGPGGGGFGGMRDPQKMVAMRVNMLAQRLSLTESQKTQATAIFTQAAASAESIRSGLQTTNTSLADAVKTNNTSAIDQLSASLGNAMGQLTAIEKKAEASFYQILTPEQQTTYSQRPQGGPPMGGPMGGGPNGFGRVRQ